MKVSFYLAIILLLLSGNVNSQENKTDSLKNCLINANSNDSSRLLNKLSKELYSVRKYSQSVSSAQKALEISQRNGLKAEEALAFKRLLLGYRGLKDSTKALKNAKVAIKMFNQQNNFEEMANTLNGVSIVYLDNGEIKKALNYGLKALKIREEHNIPSNLLYGNLALFYDLIGYHEKNLEYSLKALNAAKIEGDRIGEAIAYNGIAKAYMDSQNFIEAEKAYLNALKIFSEIDKQIKVSIIFNNLAGVYEQQGDYTKSLEFYTKSLKTKEKANYTQGEVFTLKGIGNLYLKMGELDSALTTYQLGIKKSEEINNKHLKSDLQNKSAIVYFKQRKLQKAKQLFTTSNTFATENKLMDIAKSNYFYLAKIDSINNDYSCAYMNFSNYKTIIDSLLNEEKSRQLTEMQIRYETDKKEKEIAYLTHKNTLQNRIYLALSILLFLGLVTIYLIYNKYKLKSKLREKKEQIKQEELRSVAQINKLNAEKLQEELDHRNRELTSSAINLVERNDVLIEIKNQIDNLIKKNGTNTELKKISKKISNKIEKEDEWTKLKYHFEDVHPDFFSKLQETYPEMTQNEIKLCAYTKLRLTQKEIANLLNVSLKGVQMARYRMKKKLNLSEDKSVDDFVMEIK